ncbi:MAG: hypothetical protein IPN71_07890 [Fibrobacteres bacterium]|nr:hypothetical protein [Fibrobacterota bacterium]
MQSFAKTFAVFVFFAVTAHADWTLSDYPLPATDSAAANRMYGIRAFSNPASATKVKVDSGRVVFHADYASDSTEGNSANVGFVHDLKVGEGPLNLSDLLPSAGHGFRRRQQDVRDPGLLEPGLRHQGQGGQRPGGLPCGLRF